MTNLACYSYTEFLSECLDKKSEVHGIYTDFQRAFEFDVVSYDLLLLKIENYFGVNNINLSWFRSYLNNRYQRVVLNCVSSEWFKVGSGVPRLRAPY